MKLWTTLSPIFEEQRWQILGRHIDERGAPNEYVPWPGPREAVGDLQVFEKFHHVRLSTRFGAPILRSVKLQSSWITLLGVIDGMVQSDRGWWPLCALYESFGKLLFDLGPDLDTRGSALIAGAGGVARVAIAALFKSGFRDFLLTHLNEEEAQQTIAEVKAKFFGLNLQWVPTPRIVLLPGESSILVNCTPGAEENALLTELSYMNFLKRPGFLFDIGRTSKPSLLVHEALDAGINVINGVRIASHADVLWAKWAFNVSLDFDAYLKDLEKSIAGD